MHKPAYTAVVIAAVLLATVCTTTAYSAGARSSANASVTILQPITVTTLSSLSFGRFQSRGEGTVTVTSPPPAERTAIGVQLVGGAEFNPASYTIVGEPGRAYRVTLPSAVTTSPGGFRASDFTIWSANSGALLTSGLGQLDGAGGDALNVGATVTVPAGVRPAHFTATFPITINYE